MKDKLDFGFKYLGEHEAKNIKEPVHIYKVLLEPESHLPLVAENIKSPEKPSIAVLPFDNMSDDPEQDYFSDGITEDLITDLSKISGLFVIARNSTFVYKNKSVNIKEIGKKLCVRFILEGSVRKFGNRVRINAQLIDTKTNGHLWAERYDRELINIFDIQDEVTSKIVTELTLNLTVNEKKQLKHRSTENLEAYDYVLRGKQSYWRYSEKDHSEAQILFQQAIDLDPNYAEAYSWLGLIVLHSWTQGWNQKPGTFERAYELANKALGLNDSLPEAHRFLGDIYLYQKEYEKAILELKTAISLNPNYSDALVGLADIYNWAGNPEDSILLMKRAMYLNPNHSAWYPYVYGISYLFLNEYEKAIPILEKGLVCHKDFLGIHVALSGLYAEMDRKEDAEKEIQEVLRISPGFSIHIFNEMIPLKDPILRETLTNGLRKAGLPE